MKRLCATSILASLILISISVQGQETSSLDAKLALVTDLKVPAGAISLRLQRKSETKRTQGGLLGKRWRQNWESRLMRATGRVQLEEWAGVTSFRQVGNTQEYESNSRERIVFSGDGRAVRSKLDGGTETFDTAGRLIERTYRRGNKVLLRYTAHGSLSRVEGPGGSFLSFTTDSAGRAIRVQSSTGATVNYAYDKDNLIEVAVNGGPALRYGYDAKGSPVRIEDPQTGALDIAYDSKERVASYRWVDGSEQRFEYDDAINSKRVIAPNGAATVTQEDPQKRRTEITGPLGHGA
ncbi:MAG: RHS repeat protein [Pyrinomonadaceae bacterium]|nr:RHS repeat protein [Pyrinomonadaceae bacterium]